MTDNEIKLILQLKKQGFGYKKISIETGMPQNTIKSFCRRYQKVSNPKSSEEQKVCLQCGKAINYSRYYKQQKFCSELCKRVWWKENIKFRKMKSHEEITCLTCGRKFNSYPSKHRKYCSRNCYYLSIQERSGLNEGRN